MGPVLSPVSEERTVKLITSIDPDQVSLRRRGAGANEEQEKHELQGGR